MRGRATPGRTAYRGRTRRLAGVIGAATAFAGLAGLGGLVAGGVPANAEAPRGNPVEQTDGFYVDPRSNPRAWVTANGGDERAATIDAKLASKPGARWFGDWNDDIEAEVSAYVTAADRADKLPILVAYNIPGRDCQGHSSGGAGSPEAYRAWIADFAAGLGDKPALVVIEPDALAQLDCLPDAEERGLRTDLVRYATERLAKATNTWSYLDAANAGWIAADDMAKRLTDGGLANVHGFALNVSNYYTTAESATKGKAINAALGKAKKPFVVDTSRNGNGAGDDWCNPPGRKLGVTSRVGGEGAAGAEMRLWVKVPGDSDGECGIGPNAPAGQFRPELAMALIEGK